MREALLDGSVGDGSGNRWFYPEANAVYRAMHANPL
jgi:hypothetical protein